MAWTKYSNEVIFASNNQNFKILDEHEKQIILTNDPFKLLSETYGMLDDAYSSSDSTGVNIGIQRLEGLLQLDFITSNQQKIRALLSLYFGYFMHRNNSQGRFKTYVNEGAFSSHCNKYFPSVSNFKGKRFSSISGIIKLFGKAFNNPTVTGYAEIHGWYSEPEYRYFEDNGIFDFLAGTEADNKASSKNQDTTIKSVILSNSARIILGG